MSTANLNKTRTPATLGSNDDSLHEALKLGQEEAFTQLVELHGARMYRNAFLILRNEADAQDAVQDALVNAHKGILGFRVEANLSTWLTRIVINSSFGIARKRQRRLALSLDLTKDDILGLLETLQDTSVDVEGDIILRQNQHVLRHATRKLPHFFAPLSMSTFMATRQWLAWRSAVARLSPLQSLASSAQKRRFVVSI